MDGRIVQVRFRTDSEALTALSTRAPPRSRYLRFSVGISIESEVDRLIKPGDDYVALVAEYEGLASALPHLSS
jgi:hypothetical protein